MNEDAPASLAPIPVTEERFASVAAPEKEVSPGPAPPAAEESASPVAVTPERSAARARETRLVPGSAADAVAAFVSPGAEICVEPLFPRSGVTAVSVPGPEFREASKTTGSTAAIVSPNETRSATVPE